MALPLCLTGETGRQDCITLYPSALARHRLQSDFHFTGEYEAAQRERESGWRGKEGVDETPLLGSRRWLRVPFLSLSLAARDPESADPLDLVSLL